MSCHAAGASRWSGDSLVGTGAYYFVFSVLSISGFTVFRCIYCILVIILERNKTTPCIGMLCRVLSCVSCVSLWLLCLSWVLSWPSWFLEFLVSWLESHRRLSCEACLFFGCIDRRYPFHSSSSDSSRHFYSSSHLSCLLIHSVLSSTPSSTLPFYHWFTLPFTDSLPPLIPLANLVFINK